MSKIYNLKCSSAVGKLKANYRQVFVSASCSKTPVSQRERASEDYRHKLWGKYICPIYQICPNGKEYFSKSVTVSVQIDKCISPNILNINSKFFWQSQIWTNVDFCAFVNTIIYREDFGHPGSEFLFQQTKTFSLVNYNVPSFCALLLPHAEVEMSFELWLTQA